MLTSQQVPALSERAELCPLFLKDLLRQAVPDHRTECGPRAEDVPASGIGQGLLLRLLGDQALGRMGMVWTPNMVCPVSTPHGHSGEGQFSSRVCISQTRKWFKNKPF